MLFYDFSLTTGGLSENVVGYLISSSNNLFQKLDLNVKSSSYSRNSTADAITAYFCFPAANFSHEKFFKSGSDSVEKIIRRRDQISNYIFG